MNRVTVVAATLAICVSVTATAYAQATTRFVSTTGVDVGDCSVAPCATIQFASDVATPGDTVRVAPGTAMTNAIHPVSFEAASPNHHIAFNNLFGNANGDFYGDYGGNCCSPILYAPSPGTGEISVDPMFRDPANGDYRLAPGSPSIDAGTNDNAPATDLDGLMRPIDGNGDGTAVVDMGALNLKR